MNRLLIQDKIAQSLAVFGTKISILSANNEFSWNSLAENIFIPFFNLTLDGNFVNENIESFNIYNREDLLNFIQNSKKKYKQIKRKLKFSENYSLCFLIPKADIEHLKYYQLMKTQ